MILSIITVCYNNLAGLKRTYEGLKGDFDNFEWVIIDGASKDGTVDFVENIVLVDNRNAVFVTEPDKGIFDAMNKGINFSKGEFLLFLNSGDTLDCSVNDILALKNEFLDINVFGINKRDKFNNIVKWSDLIACPSVLKRIPIPHQSTLVKKEVFLDIGVYDLNFKLLADHDFFSKAYVKGYGYKFFSEKVIATFFLDGMSSKLGNAKLYLNELERLQIKNFGHRLPFNIRIRYIYKYILSFMPFSERLMSLSRSLVFRRF